MIRFSTPTQSLTSFEDFTTGEAILAMGVTMPEKKQKDGAPLPLPAFLRDLDNAWKGSIASAVRDESFTGALGQTLFFTIPGLPSGMARLLIVGFGKESELSIESIRRAFGVLAQQASAVTGTDVLFLNDVLQSDALTLDAAAIGEAMAVGALGSTYRFFKYKKEEQKKFEKTRMKTLSVVAKKSLRADLKKGWKRGAALMEAVSLTRDIVNEPASVMTPDGVRKKALEIAKHPQISSKVLGKKELKKLGAGAHLAVAQGSDQPPYLVHLTYKPKKKAKKKIALVGKGITFDSGGLSIKPAVHMEDMKDDVTGAATVLGAIQAVAALQLPVEVHALAALAENMPSGGAVRPGDVVTASNGKTVEIVNTDAEGRLVLADTLVYTGKKIKPDVILDVATLTGMALYAFGNNVAPFMGTDEALAETIRSVSKETGEGLVEIPLVPEYAKEMKGTVSDLRNISSSQFAGTITAGHFLHAFVPEKTPWMHFDIAGPGFVKKRPYSYWSEGGTGFLVRTLVGVVQSYV